MNAYQLLDLIRRKPAMYIGENSIKNLRSYIDGYRFGIEQAGILVSEEKPDFGGFHDWVADKLGYGESTSGWQKMIASQRVDREESLWLFFQLLDEYRGLQPRILAEALLEPDNPLTVSYFIGTAGWGEADYIRPNPTSVVIEEVLPSKEWVSLSIRKDDKILSRRGFDNTEKAIRGAKEFLGIPQENWKIVGATA